MVRYVYRFGGGVSEGKAGDKALLGGKGANLAEMASINSALFICFLTISLTISDLRRKHNPKPLSCQGFQGRLSGFVDKSGLC